MKNSELIRLYAKIKKTKKVKAKELINDYHDVLEMAFRIAFKEKGKVSLRNFGTFTIKEIRRTSGRMEKIVIFKKAEKMDLG